MEGRSGLLALGAATLAVACCAGPGIVAVIGGAGIAGWLGARGAWAAAAALGLVTGAISVIAVARRRRPCSIPRDGHLAPGPGGVAILPERRGEARGAALAPPHRTLYRWILAELAAGRTVSRNALEAQAERLSVAAADAVSAMATLDLVHLDESTGSVRCAYPFSAAPTAHVVSVEGMGAGPVYAMCAVDALGIPAMLGRPATVTSHDPATGLLVSVQVPPMGDPVSNPENAVVVIAMAKGGGPLEATCCPVINFFESRRTAEAYLAQNDLAAAVVMTIPAAAATGRELFGGVMESDSPTGAHVAAAIAR